MEQPELQCLMRGCDAVILEKDDKINKSMISFGSKCKIEIFSIIVEIIRCPRGEIFNEKSI